MTKIKIIDKCLLCSYSKRRTRGFFGRHEYYVCIISTKTYTFDPKSECREIEDLNKIPEWCSLREAIPNLKELQREYETKMMMTQCRKTMSEMNKINEP